MPLIEFDGKKYETNPDETVLDCLTRFDCPPPSSCRSGLCHTCIMRAIKGKPPESSQQGLKETLQQQNYFLACSCIPTEDLTVALADASAAPHFEATLLEKNLLTPVILRLRFSVPEGFSYIPGQFLNVFRDDQLTRSYSIASVPAFESFIELHIEKIAEGKLSGWLFDELAVGDSLQLSEPLGECYYLPGNPEKNLMMVATGSGLAPIYGVVRDALNQGHQGEIYIYHGSSNPDKIYLMDEMKKLVEDHANLHYIPCLSKNAVDGFTRGRANEIALEQHKDLKDWRLYLCGHPSMVADTKRRAFLAGASLNDIFADPFEFSS